MTEAGRERTGGYMAKKRIRLIVAYDGTNYHGWQIQNNGITVEAELNRCLSDLLGESIEVIGASRTDSGVHALGNVAVFDTNTRIPAEKISYALNQRLPEDIVVQKSEEVNSDFHPRHCSSRKTYEYRILNREFRDPTRRKNMYLYHHALDVEKMQQGAAYLEGQHDYKSFCGNSRMKKSTVRIVDTITIRRRKGYVYLTFHGTGFLQNMVRIMAGTLIEVGLGHIAPEQVGEILEARDRKVAGPTAPAKGLCLVKVDY